MTEKICELEAELLEGLARRRRAERELFLK